VLLLSTTRISLYVSVLHAGGLPTKHVCDCCPPGCSNRHTSIRSPP
jgi:hypothetical protein